MPEYVRLLKGHTRRVDGVIPDPVYQNYVYSYANDNVIFKWNLLSGERELICQTKYTLKAIQIFHSSLLVLEEYSLKLIDIEKKKEKTVYKSDVSFNNMEVIYLNSLSPVIVISTTIGKIVVLDGNTFKKVSFLEIDSNPLKALKAITITTTKYLVISTSNGVLILFDLLTMTEAYRFDTNINEETHAIEWDGQTSSLFIGGHTGIISCYKVSFSNKKFFFNLNYRLTGHSQGITALYYDEYFLHHPILWSASNDECIRAWILDANPKQILQFRPLNYALTCLLIVSTHTLPNMRADPFPRKLLIGSTDHTLRLWNVGILNFFPQIWGLRSALLEKWNSWRVDLPHKEFPYLFKNALENIDVLINQVFSQLSEQITVQSRPLVDHQWHKTINEFEQIFSYSSIRVDAEEVEINKLLVSFTKQLTSMDAGLSQYLQEQLLGEFTKYVNEYSQNFTEEFIIKFQTNLINISKTLLIDSKVMGSTDEVFEWFFSEIKLVLSYDLDQWVNDLKVLIGPIRARILQDWLVKNKETIQIKLSSKESEFRNQIHETWLTLLKQELYTRLDRLKERQSSKIIAVQEFIKEFKKLDNRFIYLSDLASRLSVFPSLVYQELVRLLEKDVITGMLLDDQRGYYYINLNEKTLLQRKNKLDQRIEMLLRVDSKKHTQERNKIIVEYQDFWEWIKTYNIHQYDTEIQQKLVLLQNS